MIPALPTMHSVPTYDCLIVNGTVVTASDTACYDIAIKDGKIALLTRTGLLDHTVSKRVIDAEGAYVMVSDEQDSSRIPQPMHLQIIFIQRLTVSSPGVSTPTSTWQSLSSLARDARLTTSRPAPGPPLLAERRPSSLSRPRTRKTTPCSPLWKKPRSKR